MRTPVVPTLVTALVVLALSLAGCSDDAESGTDADPPFTPSSTGPTTSPSSSPSDPTTAPTTRPDQAACDEVIAGIAAFNAGDLDATVEHFELAVPLAEAEADATPGDKADALLEAVRYYAELPAEDYPAAAAGSTDFAKYKAITLGQCVGGPTQPAPPSSSGVAI